MLTLWSLPISPNIAEGGILPEVEWYLLYIKYRHIEWPIFAVFFLCMQQIVTHFYKLLFKHEQYIDKACIYGAVGTCFRGGISGHFPAFKYDVIAVSAGFVV